MSRRGATALVGVLPVDKPSGMTSHDVVAAVRRATGEGRVGHAGTLDPMATGLLVVLIGAYARLAPFLTGASKSYDATITFGTETDTDDAEGTTVRSAPVPDALHDMDYARGVLATFLGRSAQVPPAYSAIKQAGQTAHRAAREGRPLALEAREIDVEAANLLELDPSLSTWRVAFTVSKGTYIRSLARDIGRACASAAHLSSLRRTSSGALTLADAHTLDDVIASAAEGHLGALLSDPVRALALPCVEAPDASVLVGAAFDAPADLVTGFDAHVTVTHDGRLAGVYRHQGARLLPVAVFPGGDPA